MEKYLKMLPIMLYPYAYLIPLIILFNTPTEGANVGMLDYFIFIYAIALHILVLFIAIYNSVVTGKGKYDLVSATKINMLTKCVQIPAYIFHFFMALMGIFMSVWGIGIIAFVIVVDFMSVLISGISSIGCSCYMRKTKALSKTGSVLMGIGSFLYCVDVVISIVYFIIARKKDKPIAQ